MVFNEDQKLQVLLVEMQERYNASHKIRERSVKFTLWISGMAIGLGWLLISQKALFFSQRIALTLLIFALSAGTIYFIMGLRRGFMKNRAAIIRNEQALGMHDKGVYIEDSPLLPVEYGNNNKKWSDHFHTIYVWLILVALSLFILTWTSPAPQKNFKENTKTEHMKGGKENGQSQ